MNYGIDIDEWNSANVVDPSYWCYLELIYNKYQKHKKNLNYFLILLDQIRNKKYAKRKVINPPAHQSENFFNF